MERLTVQLNNTECTVYIGGGALRYTGELLRRHIPSVRRWALAADMDAAALYGDMVRGALCAAGLETELYLMPAGEAAKRPEAWLSLCGRLLDDGFDRGCGVITLGGGACGDAAGFAAATLLRGVPLVHLPTTLLSQVDSALGGKTALDMPQGKNLLGVFHQPRLVVADPACLATLPRRQFVSGMAEVIKTGCVADAGLLDTAEQGISQEGGDALTAMIAGCCRTKLRLVSEDTEDRGMRRLLNFGHTFGHAYEAAGAYERYTHGEAVAAGMCRMLRWQIAHGHGGETLLPRLEALLRQWELPTAIDCGREELRRYLTHDKKACGGQVTLAIVPQAGRGELLTVPLAALWEEDA